ncbi:MAG: tetratricopeptide repeat protein [Candidatus Tectomicrobia bacterium]|uniref:peptidylprolyl isomerase n=1 Tax=Tectimicrobiota bacterium TaxID=2528274 RepID=A0A937W319_UNCTE|nr:tetratricopeptide repeat protein [Candidatus Tectomicrobia bacterium]
MEAMTPVWDIGAGSQPQRADRHARTCIFGWLSVLLLCLGTVELVMAQEERALRRIVVDDRQTAQDILQQLRQGASFSALARARSLGAEASQWGYSGTVRLSEMQPAMRAVVQKLKEGQTSDVLELGRQFVILKAISPRIARHFEAAEQAERAKKFPQALQEIQAALRLEEDNVQAHMKLGLIEQGTKKFGEAIRHFEKAQQYAPQEAQVALFVATAYTHAATESQNTAQAEKAMQAFQRVLQLDGRYAPSVHFGLGKVYLLALRQPDKAIDYLTKAAEATTSVAEPHRLLIKAYYDMQRYEQAWQTLRRAQDMGFDFPDLLAALQKTKQQSQR